MLQQGHEVELIKWNKCNLQGNQHNDIIARIESTCSLVTFMGLEQGRRPSVGNARVGKDWQLLPERLFDLMWLQTIKGNGPYVIFYLWNEISVVCNNDY